MRRNLAFRVAPLAALALFAALPVQSGAWHSPAPTIVALRALPAHARAPTEARAMSSEAGLRTLRATSDLPDAVAGPQTHVIYFVPADAPDESLDTRGVIARSVASMLDWFRAQIGRAPRTDRRSDGTLDVTFVRGELAGSAYRRLRGVAAELARRGFAASHKRYLVYAALPTGSVCGEAEYPGRYGAVYLDATAGCFSRDFGTGTARGAGGTEVIAAQEWLHNEGLVPLTAPHHCALAAGHVCTASVALLVPRLDPEQIDVMYPIVTGLRLSQKVLDADHLDYHRHPLPTADLADSRYME